MIKIKDTTYYGIQETVKMLGIHRQTLLLWLRWYENDHYIHPDDVEFPEAIKVAEQIRLFSEEDIEKLKKFKRELPNHWGLLAETVFHKQHRQDLYKGVKKGKPNKEAMKFHEKFVKRYYDRRKNNESK